LPQAKGDAYAQKFLQTPDRKFYKGLVTAHVPTSEQKENLVSYS
jgi:hypothetical protein